MKPSSTNLNARDVLSLGTEHAARKPGRFNTTQWSLIFQARQSGDEQQRNSWNDLIQRYWYPLYVFCRRRGSNDQDAQDLTQGFFTHLLESTGLDSVSPEKGRFRSFLLVAFRNYIANQARNASTIRRGGNFVIQSLDAQEQFAEICGRDETPEQAFESSWVDAMLRQVRERLEQDYRAAGREELFHLLIPHLTASSDGLPRTEICERLKLSAAAVAMSIHRMRRRFGELLINEVSLTVENPEDAADELRRLMAIVRGER